MPSILKKSGHTIACMIPDFFCYDVPDSIFKNIVFTNTKVENNLPIFFFHLFFFAVSKKMISFAFEI